MQFWQYCLLVTEKLLYIFRTLSASIIRSINNCRSSHWCMPWVGFLRSVATALPVQWQPTSEILTGYTSSRPMACTNGCFYNC